MAENLGKQKRFRQGQILKLISSEAIASQDELRRRLAHLKLRVTQATLSRDIAELHLVKTASGDETTYQKIEIFSKVLHYVQTTYVEPIDQRQLM